jgi:phosphate transport system substrate-binding protein
VLIKSPDRYIVTSSKASDTAKDFIDYILSQQGQDVIEKSGYIRASDAPAYAGSKPSGKVVVAGSSSVTPVMEKLKEAYLAVNPGADIEIQMSDSTTGMTSAIDGICDIGMASRELKDSEKEKGLVPTVIAIDGIAVVVNKQCPPTI